MGILDAPGVSPGRARVANLLARLAGSNTLAIPVVAPTDDIPTVTTSATQTVTGQLVGPQTDRVTVVGSRGSWDASQGRLAAGAGLSGIDAYHTGSVLEYTIFPNVNGSTPIWIWVNGAPATAAPASITTTSSTTIYVKLVFPSAARRRVEFFCLHGGHWRAINVDVNTLITAAPRRPVVAFVGDSFYDGSLGTPKFLCAPFLMSRMLGVEAYSQSYGGTGYVDAGAFNTFGSGTRVSAVAAADPELILVQGTLNDDNQPGVQAAAAAAYAAYAAACPSAKLIVFGPQPNDATSTISANRSANIAAVKAAADAAPNVLAFHDLVGSAAGVPAAWASGATYNEGDLVTRIGSVWRWSNGGTAGNGSSPGTAIRWALVTCAYTGTGRVGATTGDGTRDTLLYSDSVHPTAEASAALAITEANLVRSDLAAYGLT